MKTIIYITAFLLTLTAITYSQSIMEFEAGSALTNDSGADISVDVMIMNGTYTGGGTINGNIAYILNLTVLIEGFYNQSTDTMVPDTIQVYLRNAVTPFAIVDSAKSVLNDSGTGTFIFNNISNGINYYLDIKHRNSIETWSKTYPSFASFFETYDFSNADTQAFGNNMAQVNTSPVKFAIYSGDVNQDGLVDIADIVECYNASSTFLTGYVSTDVNGDGLVDIADVVSSYNNSVNFVQVMRP